MDSPGMVDSLLPLAAVLAAAGPARSTLLSPLHPPQATAPLDTIVFGDPSSEAAHGLTRSVASCLLSSSVNLVESG